MYICDYTKNLNCYSCLFKDRNDCGSSSIQEAIADLEDIRDSAEYMLEVLKKALENQK